MRWLGIDADNWWVTYAWYFKERRRVFCRLTPSRTCVSEGGIIASNFYSRKNCRSFVQHRYANHALHLARNGERAGPRWLCPRYDLFRILDYSSNSSMIVSGAVAQILERFVDENVWCSLPRRVVSPCCAFFLAGETGDVRLEARYDRCTVLFSHCFFNPRDS